VAANKFACPKRARKTDDSRLIDYSNSRTSELAASNLWSVAECAENQIELPCRAAILSFSCRLLVGQASETKVASPIQVAIKHSLRLLATLCRFRASARD